MGMQLECAQEILEAVFDGACSDEERRELFRIMNDPEMTESLIQEAFIHGLLQWNNSSQN
jgi:hypothetical protein